MSRNDPTELLQTIHRAHGQNLCPNRIWLAGSSLNDWKAYLASSLKKFVKLLPKDATQHEDHSACTLDFCEFSTRSFTSIQQYHERRPYEGWDQAMIAKSHRNKYVCLPTKGLFDDRLLVEAVRSRRLTAWTLDGLSILKHPRRFMAISHVWSDGTGAGTWTSKSVNECLYTYFTSLAEKFSCEGIWWDVICIPNDRRARGKALQIMDLNYAYARVTFVHDRFLRKLHFLDPDTACLAIIMSAWFTRGWTALELARSRKVMVAFKDSIKDLDQEILRRASKGNLAAELIQNLRDAQVSSIEALLVTLGTRYTSWVQDRATIARLLTGLPMPDTNGQADDQNTFQRDTYQAILRHIGKVSHYHLFHNSVTMTGGFSWCATSLFQLPQITSEAKLRVHDDGALSGYWKIHRADAIILEKCIWGRAHELVEARIRHALQTRSNSHIILVVPPEEWTDEKAGSKTILVEILTKHEQNQRMIKAQFIGSLQLNEALDDEGLQSARRIVIGGDMNGWERLQGDENAWQIACQGLLTERSFRKSPESMHPQTRIDPQRSKNIQSAASRNRRFEEQSGPPKYDSTKLAARSEPETDTSQQDPISALSFDSACRWTRLHHDVWLDRMGMPAHYDTGWIEADCFGQQVLHLAAERGNLRMIETLLEKSGSKTKSLEAQDKDLQTALHRAAWGACTKSVDLLLEKCSETTRDEILNAKDRFGDTALHVAACMGSDEVVQCLLTHAGAKATTMVQTKGRRGLTPLHQAAMSATPRAVSLFLEHGAAIDSSDNDFGWTPLHCASDSGNDIVLSLMLDAGAKVRKTDQAGWIPLHLAAMGGHLSVAALLIRKDFQSIHLKDRYGWTAINFAAINGHASLVEEYSKLTTATSASDDLCGWKAFYATVTSHKAKFREEKIETDSKPEHFRGISRYEMSMRSLTTPTTPARTHTGPTARRRPSTISASSMERNQSHNRLRLGLLHLIALDGRSNVIPQILHSNIPPSAQLIRDDSLLHWASFKGLRQTCALLVQLGADQETQDLDARTPLWACATHRQIFVAQLLIENHADRNVIDKHGRTLLTFAADRGLLWLAKLLVDIGGIDVNAKDSYGGGNPPLHYAAKNGHAEIVQLLLDTGRAEVNTRDINGMTPLYHATVLGDENIVRSLLLTLRADANIQDPYGWTPLWIAVFNEDEKIVDMLIKIGHADPDHKELQLGTPLMNAAQSGHSAILRQLLATQKVDVNAKTLRGHTALFRAADRGHESVVKQLLAEKEVDHDPPDHTNLTPLSVAVSNNHEATVRVLLETAKVNVNSRDGSGNTPLLHAIANRNEQIFRLLVTTYQAQVDILDSHGRSAISFASQVGSETMISMLLAKHQAYVDLKDSQSRTPLSYAAEHGHVTIVRLLLQHKVQVDSRDKEGRTPLSYCAATGNEGTGRLLLNLGKAKVNSKDSCKRTPLFHSIQDGNEAMVWLLLDNTKTKIDLKDLDRRAPLSYACQFGLDAVVDHLLKRKVEIDSADNFGRTPLSYAAGTKRTGILRRLLEEKVRINSVSKDGWSPLWYAARNGHTESVRLLFNTGKAKISACNGAGETPLSEAAFGGHKETVMFLLDHEQPHIDKRNRQGLTPLWLAAADGHTDVVSQLLETQRVDVDSIGKEKWSPLLSACRFGHLETARVLLNQGGAKAGLQDIDGKTALTWAAEIGSVEMVKLIVDADRSQASHRDNHGRTPFKYAELCHREDVVQFFRNEGLDEE